MVGKFLSALTCLSVATYLSLYPVVLVVPCMQVFCNRIRKNQFATIFVGCSYIAIFLLLLIIISNAILNDWSFFTAIYGHHLTFSELKPNVGLAWYLFVEMFDHFRSFFLFVFQGNLFIYLVPMSIKFR